MIAIQITSKDIQPVIDRVGWLSGRLQKMISRSVNRAVTAAKKVIADGLVEVTTVKNRKKLVDKVFVKLANPRTMAATIQFRRRPLGAINYAHQLVNKRAMVQVHKSEISMSFRNAFIGTLSNGNTHLIIRQGKSRKAIRPVYGARIGVSIDRNPQIKLRAQERAREIVVKRLISQVRLMKESPDSFD